VSQYCVDDLLILDATVRRLDDDPHRATAAAANLDIDIEHTFQWCATRRWAQLWVVNSYFTNDIRSLAIAAFTGGHYSRTA
jgi:hypothetical protein